MEMNKTEMKLEEATIDSRDLAKELGKRHIILLQKIDRLRKRLTDNGIANGIKVFEEKIKEYRGHEFRYVMMNRPAVSLLVMSISGKKALEWMLNYLETFYEMEDRLRDLEYRKLNEID